MKNTTCLLLTLAPFLSGAIARTAGADGYSSKVLSHGPIAYWRLNEGGGKKARDIVDGHTADYDETYNSPSFRQPGGVKESNDRSTGFTGGKLWSTVPYDSALNPSGAFTVSFLVNLNQRYHDWSTGGYWHTAANTWHAWRDPGSRNGWSYEGFFIGNYPPNQLWYFYLGSWKASTAQPYGYNVITGGRTTPGRWDHVTCTFTPDGGTNEHGMPTGTMALYSNGALVSSLAGRAHGPNTVMPFVIGAHNTAHENRTPYWQHTLDGDLDELAVFNKALSVEEIRELVFLSKVYDERTYFVRKTGSDTNDGRTPETAFASFQHAANQCRAGDTVYVGAGEYNYTGNYRFYGTGFEDLPIQFIADKTGEHTGDAGDVVMSGTITKTLNADGVPTSCTGNWPFRAYDANDLHFRGFKFQESYCPLAFHNCERTVIDDCEFTDHGYAIYHPGGSATITNVNVHDNTYHGILCYYGSYSVSDTTITNPGSYGLYFYQRPRDEATPSTYCKAERVEIRGARSYTLMGYYGTVDLIDCVFEDNRYGVYLYAYHLNKDWHPSHKVKNLTMRRTTGNWSLMGYYCEMDLEDSTFEDNKYGVYLRGNYPHSDLPSTYNIDNLTVRGTEGSWALSVYNGDTTLRDSTFENNFHGAAISDHATHTDINRLNCIAENVTFKDHKGWALTIGGLDADVRDITSENNRYSIQFSDKRRTSGSDNRCKFTAERIRNTGSQYYGLLSYRCDLTLTDSQFIDNTHGIYLFEDANVVGTGAQAYIDRVEICRNKKSWGVINYRTDLDMRNSLVADNLYGMYLYDMDEGSQLWHVTIVNHRSHGIYNYRGQVDIYNCLSTGALQGYGLYNYRGTVNNGHNLIVGNYRNYYGTQPGLGSGYEIPLFAADDDYHLMDTSDGVNRGLDPGDLCEHDLENYDRGQNGGWNIGCYATTAPGWDYDDLPHAYSQNNPVSWWRLGEKAGDETAIDIIGNNHGTYKNGVQRAAVSPISTDGCAFFSNANHHIRVPHHEKYMIDDGTVLMWYRVKEMPSSWTGLFSKNKPGLSAGETTFWMLKPYNGRSYIYHEAANRYWVLYSRDPGTLGEWTFLAYTFGSAGVGTYENGALVLHYYQEKTGWNATEASPGNLEPIYIGGTTWYQQDQADRYWPFVGWIDEVAIFDRQLSSAEIARIYRAALNPKKDPDDMQIPPIWGVTGTDGRLFRIDDYTDPGNTSTDFGPIEWKNGSSVEPVGTNIDSIAADGNRTAYLLVNKTLGSHLAPVVMRLSLQDAESGLPLVAEPMSTIDIAGGVDDVAVDPGSGLLYALGADGRLYSFDPVTGDVVTDFGDLKNDAQGLDVEGGKSLMFDQIGGLYVLDAYDNHLYRVDKNTALIRRVPDYKYGGGLEASAWDHLNSRAVASNTTNDTLRHLTLIPGNNPSFGSLGGTGLSNVTGLSFVPNEGRGNTSGGWRMIDWIEIR